MKLKKKSGKTSKKIDNLINFAENLVGKEIFRVEDSICAENPEEKVKYLVNKENKVSKNTGKHFLKERHYRTWDGT